MFLLIFSRLLSQVTTARKAVTLLLSYMIFTKPLTGQHATGLLLIAMGIVLKLLPEHKPYNRASNLPSPDKNGKSTYNQGEMRKELEYEGEDEENRPLV